MLVRFWTFAKETNSTAKPSASSVVAAVNGTLRESCSTLSPVIGFTFSAFENIARYTYAQIDIFGGRYYFIDNWTWADGLWIASMRVDPLASYRAQILETSQYILRSASASDGSIKDSAYPITTSYVNSTRTGSMLPADVGNCYIVGVVGKGLTTGVVNYYAFKPEDFEAFSEKLLGTFIDAVQAGISEIGADLTKVLLNPIQYITSVRWYPFNAALGAVAQDISFGWWTVNCKCVALTDAKLTSAFSCSISDIPAHRYANTRGRYLNHEPYTSYYLTFKPFAAQVALNSAAVAGAISSSTPGLYCDLKVDLTTGGAVFTVTAEPGSDGQIYTLYTSVCTVGADMPIAQITSNIYAAAASAVGTISDAAKSAAVGNYGEAAGDLFSGILSAAQTAAPCVSITGSAGTRANYDRNVVLNIVHRLPVNDDNTHLGRPLCMYKRLADLSGFTLCGNPHVDIDIATAGEREQIETYMKEGFYLE